MTEIVPPKLTFAIGATVFFLGVIIWAWIVRKDKEKEERQR